jgi:hypothetical protein
MQFRLTFDRFATPVSGHFVDYIRDRPILVPNLHRPHCEFGSVPSGLEDVCASSCDRLLCCRTYDDGLCTNGSEPVDMGTKLKFHNIVFGERLR